MALQAYQIDEFKGIDQSRSENRLSPSYSPDAQNMDTENGDLAVAKGYVPHFQELVPGEERIRRMYLWHSATEDRFIVIAGNTVYRYMPEAEDAPASWISIYEYQETLTSDNWDFEEMRIGEVDHLIIANGQTQMIKWDGTNQAVLFGSGEFVYEGTLASFAHNVPKAVSVQYTESGAVGTVTLTMPTGWSYTAGAELAFTAQAAISLGITSMRAVIGSNTYDLDYVPAWLAGETAVIKLISATEAEHSSTVYGIMGVTLNSPIDVDWKQRALDVGLRIGEYFYPISELTDDRLIATLKEPATDTFEIGQEVKVRGGVSDRPVSFIEMHYSRLFSAGDPEHPSRLYWSQPPGDTRTIEDWSQDEFSDITSGGHVEVGNTASDPIVGLCSLSNQLLIFKETSIYRLLGDRPNNYRLTHVNLSTERMVNTALVAYGDVPFWLTRSGMYFHDGQKAVLSGAARQIRQLLAGADLARCKAVENRARLYFTLRRGDGEYNDSIIVYDMTDRTYMLRNGFHVIDLCAYDGTLYMINERRRVYRFGEGDDYDGEPIDAYWTTPMTDLSAKSVSKEKPLLMLRGVGATIIVEYTVSASRQEKVTIMPPEETTVRREYLKNLGKAFRFRIRNENGSYFRLTGGIEVSFNKWGD